MDHVQSMPLITLGMILLTAFMAVGVSQKVMSEISQIVKSVIRCAINVSTMRNQKKDPLARPSTKFLTVAKQLTDTSVLKCGGQPTGVVPSTPVSERLDKFSLDISTVLEVEHPTPLHPVT
eukprot:2339950-Amphidinium_carterae.1